MTGKEIKQAVDSGQQVCYSNAMYRVIKDKAGQYLIIHTLNGSCVGLTGRDGLTLNGNSELFYII